MEVDTEHGSEDAVMAHDLQEEVEDESGSGTTASMALGEAASQQSRTRGKRGRDQEDEKTDESHVQLPPTSVSSVGSQALCADNSGDPVRSNTMIAQPSCLVEDAEMRDQKGRSGSKSGGPWSGTS